MMVLSHYTDEKPWSLRDWIAPPDCYDPLHKPHGLWLSVDGEDDWPAWCEAESFALDRLQQRHVFAIVKPERIRMIGTVAELEAFHREYCAARDDRSAARWGREYVDWARVMADCGGIIIAPYLWDRRLSGTGSRWYYSWDCASGCIWDVSAVRHVRSEPFDVAARTNGP
jgi:hypothetical protein